MFVQFLYSAFTNFIYLGQKMDNLLKGFQDFEINKENMNFLKGGKKVKSYEVLEVGVEKNLVGEWVSYMVVDLYFEDGTQACMQRFSDS